MKTQLNEIRYEEKYLPETDKVAIGLFVTIDTDTGPITKNISVLKEHTNAKSIANMFRALADTIEKIEKE